jgi:hypothetical protein
MREFDLNIERVRSPRELMRIVIVVVWAGLWPASAGRRRLDGQQSAGS